MPDILRMPESRAEEFLWPFFAMEHLARMTYLYDIWLGYGHSTRACRTIDHTYPGSAFSGLLMEQVLSMPAEAATFKVQGHVVHCLGLYALYPLEVQFLLEEPHGSAHEMMHRFQDEGLHEGIIPGRPSLV
jgi:hypothetical protein